MTDKKVVLVTGAAGYWGSRVAARLATESGLHVLGLDIDQPSKPCKGVDSIQADIRNPLLLELIGSEGVDTVCHLAFVDNERPSEATFDLNVMGAMKVLGACAQAGVRKVIVKSTTAVYGAHSDNSAFLTESHPLRGSRRSGYIRDMVEIESFINGFRRHAPDMIVTVLRFPSVIGPTVDEPLTRFLREPWTPILFGFDPLLQVIHEDDAVEALAHAVVNDAPGVFNVAAEGVLPLLRIIRLAQKIPLPIYHPLVYAGANLLGGAGLRLTRYAPIELDYIRYSWVGDLAKMRQELGFAPHYTAEEALREFAERQRLSHYLPESAALAYDEEQLRDTIDRRRRLRERRAQTTIDAEGGDDHEQ